MRFARRQLIASALLFSLIAGCAMAPPRQTANLTVSRSGQYVARMLDRQAQLCWSRAWSFTRDGVKIDERKLASKTYFLSAARLSSRYGPADPFFSLIVKDAANGKASVTLNEGAYACSLVEGCFSLGYTQDVKRWLGGNFSCGKDKEPWF